MTKCTGAERLRVITNWLNNIEDPKWEVQPTVKEGKYIVRPRKTPLKQETYEELNNVSEGESIDEPGEEEEQEETPPPKTKQKSKPKTKPKPEPKKKTKAQTQIYDTNNTQLQILEQLKMFGEEMRRQKEKKERKKEIKKQIQKQLPQQPQQQPEQIQQPQQEQPKQYVVRRRRLRFT